MSEIHSKIESNHSVTCDFHETFKGNSADEHPVKFARGIFDIQRQSKDMVDFRNLQCEQEALTLLE